MAFEEMNKLGIGLVTLVIVLAVGFLIVASIRTQASATEGIVYNASDCKNSVTCNATGTLQTSMATIPTWAPIIVIVVIGAILIGLVSYFKGKK